MSTTTNKAVAKTAGKTSHKPAHKTPEPQAKRGRWTVVAILAAAVFFGTYSFASAKTGRARTASASPTAALTGTAVAAEDQAAGAGGCCGSGGGAPAAAAPDVQAQSGAAGAPAAGGGCCGGGAPAGAATTKAATVEGNIQRITVDLSKGYYDPTTIELKAGIPAEITFGQGGGCLAQVQSQDLGFFEDLSGGAKTINVAALTPGTYTFTCGMQMVSGSIVVK